ncbi:hypothetical protein ACA910_003086 [Epithemia clementina (nom. ined.)]
MLLWLISILLVVLAAFGAYYYFFSFLPQQKLSENAKKDGKSLGPMGPVPLEDFVIMFNRLRPDSTHMDVLLSVLCMNSILERATDEIDKIEELREKRRKQIEQEQKLKKDQLSFDDLVDAGGWDDENEDEAEGEDGAANEAVKRAKEEEKRKEAELARLRKATGKTLPPMEGLDKGVIGQEWVMRVLGELNAWPPKLGALGDEKLVYKPAKGSRSGQKLKPMDHPAFCRCLCMTMGRLHSHYLNTHSELVEAGLKKLADETYFKATMEFRQRIALTLDAAVRIALSLQSFPLVATIIETLAAFKIGCDPNDAKSLPWFNGTMARQYNTLPRLDIGTLFFEKPRDAAKVESTEEPERLTDLVAGQQAVIVLPVDRKHAEAFTKVKIEQCKQQGIPPQMALQGYREAWWFLIRWEAISKDTLNEVEEIPPKFIEQLDDAAANRLKQTSPDLRVRTAFPMMVQNIAQKSGAVKVRINAPKNPGKYKIMVAVKSQEFLGADQELSIDANVVVDVSADTNEPSSTTAGSTKEVEPKKNK